MTVMFSPKFIITLTLTTNESNTATHTNKGGTCSWFRLGGRTTTTQTSRECISAV